METKRRNLPFKQRSMRGILRNTTTQKPSGITTKGEVQQVTEFNGYPIFTGKQVTASESHPGWHTRKGRAKTDIGGDFFTQKSYLRDGGIQRVQYSGVQVSSGLDVAWTYNGPLMLPHMQLLQFPPAFPADNDRLDELGATAIARCKPTNSVADLSTMLGEILMGGLPAVLGARSWESKTLTAKQAGSEYLNVEYGWKPLVDDVLKVGLAMDQADTLIKQYWRDAGKIVRRRYTFPTETSHESRRIMNGVSPATAPTGYNMYKLGTQTGQVWRHRSMTTRRWFSGAFTYWLPGQPGSLWNTPAELDKLFGISLTPETLWNLSPWSWAVDWFTNAGDVISNLQDFASDGLVMRYGYIMEHTLCEDTITFEGPTLLNGTDARPTPLTLVTETKVRRKANPFGFGVTWEGLTDRQAAITAALGLTKTSS